MLLSGWSYAQPSIRFQNVLPAGYQLADANDNHGPKVEKDFDRDGKPDLAIIIFDKKTGSPMFCMYLSSSFGQKRTIQYIDWPYMMHSLSYKDGVLEVFSDNGSMGGGTIWASLKLSYDAGLGEMKVTEYTAGHFKGKKQIKLDQMKL